MGSDDDYDDLFDASDEDEAQPRSPARSPQPAAPEADEEEEPQGLEDLEDDIEEPGTDEGGNRAGHRKQYKDFVPVATGKPIDVEIPLLPLPSRDRVCLLRTTNIVGIDCRPFDPATFEAEEVHYTDDLGHRRVRLRDANVIRWRYRENSRGEVIKESNARIVKWSDGSQSLFIGDEAFELTNQDMSHNNVYLYACHHNPKQTVYQGQGQVRSRVVFRPASLQSSLHKRLKAAVSERHSKRYKVAEHTTMADPEREKREKERAIEEQNRSREQLLRKQNRQYMRYTAPAPRLDEDFLEADDDEVDYGRDIRGTSGGLRSTYDDDDREAGRRLQAAKRVAPPLPTPASRRRRDASDDDDDAAGAGSDGGVDRRARIVRDARPVVKRGVLYSDDEDE